MEAQLLLSPEDRALINELTNEIRQSKNHVPPVLVSCAEAARLIGKSRVTISAYVKQKILTKRTIEGVTGILLSDLLELMNPS